MSIGFTLPLQRGDGGYFEVSNDLLTQIKSNFINLVSTMKGERMSSVMNRRFESIWHNHYANDTIWGMLDENAEGLSEENYR